MKRYRPKVYADLGVFEVDDGLVMDCFIDEDINEYIREYSGCKFDHVHFFFTDLERSSFVDCEFNSCDFSNCDLSNSSIVRCEFINCKYTGVNLAKTYLRDLLFEKCNMQYCSLGEAKLERVEWIESDLTDGYFSSTKFKDVSFKDTNLTHLEVYNTPFKGIDLSSDEIGGMMIAMNDLAKATISSSQAVQVAMMLGMKVKG